MKPKYTLFRRGTVYYSQDSATGKQTSLRTKDETEARSLLNARNEAQRQPVLNLHLARAYLTASDPAFVERTWQTVMAQLQARGRESSRERFATAFKSPALDGLRHKKLLETTADDFFAVFKDGKPSTLCFLKRLHHLALSAGWIALPIVAPNLWPRYKPKDRRGITQEEHQTLLALEKNAEWKLYLELLWETGAAQSDAVNFKAEDVDWQTRTISYLRKKTGSLAQFTISTALEKVLQQLPTTGALFPNLSTLPANHRANVFRYHRRRAGVSGVTLHCYRYAWAERAKTVGMPERFAQAALGHGSKAIHRAYAKKALIIVPSLDDYERKAASPLPMVTA
jgi:integrase